MTMTVGRVFPLVLIAAALTICLRQPVTGISQVSSVTDSTQPSDGALHGHLYGVGGPAPGAPQPWAGTVTVTGVNVRLDIAVGPDGVYSVTLPPGSYVVEGHSPDYSDGKVRCQAAHAAQVTHGGTTTLDVFCQMR